MVGPVLVSQVRPPAPSFQASPRPEGRPGPPSPGSRRRSRSRSDDVGDGGVAGRFLGGGAAAAAGAASTAGAVSAREPPTRAGEYERRGGEARARSRARPERSDFVAHVKRLAPVVDALPVLVDASDAATGAAPRSQPSRVAKGLT